MARRKVATPPHPTWVQRELLNVFKASGLTMEQLRTRSRIKLSRVSLWRKMNGFQGLDPVEVDVIARALTHTIVLGHREAA